MAYVDYDPAEHQGLPLYALESAHDETTGVTATVLREVTDPEELAAAAEVPYFYVVKTAAE